MLVGVLLLSLSEPHLLLLSLQGLSLCLEEEVRCSLVSQLSGCSFARGERFPWQDDFLLFVESGAWGDDAPEFLPLILHDSSSLWEELGACSLMWGDWCLSSLGSGLRFFLPVSGDMETSCLESVKVNFLEQKAIS